MVIGPIERLKIERRMVGRLIAGGWSERVRGVAPGEYGFLLAGLLDRLRGRYGAGMGRNELVREYWVLYFKIWKERLLIWR